MNERPKRKAIPVSVKIEACLLLLGFDDPKAVQWDHDPAIGLRPVNVAGDDYDPPQLDPRRIFPMLTPDHARKTDGDPAIPLSGDKSRIAKAVRLERKRLADRKAKRTWPKGRRIESRGFQRKEDK